LCVSYIWQRTVCMCSDRTQSMAEALRGWVTDMHTCPAYCTSVSHMPRLLLTVLFVKLDKHIPILVNDLRARSSCFCQSAGTNSYSLRFALMSVLVQACPTLSNVKSSRYKTPCKTR
jgi:hypothetical protein